MSEHFDMATIIIETTEDNPLDDYLDFTVRIMLSDKTRNYFLLHNINHHTTFLTFHMQVRSFRCFMELVQECDVHIEQQLLDDTIEIDIPIPLLIKWHNDGVLVKNVAFQSFAELYKVDEQSLLKVFEHHRNKLIRQMNDLNNFYEHEYGITII